MGVDYENMETELRISGDRQKGVFKHGSIQYFKRDNSERTDYHTNFTTEFFIEYYREQILKLLRRPSLIIMDRAAYHMVKEAGDIDTTKAAKVELREYLLGKGVEFEERMSAGELRILAKKRMIGDGEEGNLLEKMTENYPIPEGHSESHRILFLPQYHPEFNPIEMAWALVKKPIANTASFNITKIMHEQLPKTFCFVDALHSSRLFDHVDKEIQRHVYYDEGGQAPVKGEGDGEDTQDTKYTDNTKYTENGNGLMPPCLSRKRFIRYIENFPLIQEVEKQGRRFGVIGADDQYEGSTRMGTSIIGSTFTHSTHSTI